MPPLKSDLDYTIRRSARARRVRVTVGNDGSIVVTLPQRAAERRAAEAVVELRPWIDRRLRALSRAADELARTPGTVPYLGEELRLVPQIGRERVHRRGEFLLIPEREASEALERYYRRQARAEIEPRLDAAVARAGTHYRALTIRNQRTRWG